MLAVGIGGHKALALRHVIHDVADAGFQRAALALVVGVGNERNALIERFKNGAERLAASVVYHHELQVVVRQQLIGQRHQLVVRLVCGNQYRVHAARLHL